MSLKANERAPMSTTLIEEMQRIVRAAAEPRPCGDSVKSAIGRAARALRLNYRRAYTFWHGYQATVLAEEADRLRSLDWTLMRARYARLEAELSELEAQINERSGKSHDTSIADHGSPHAHHLSQSA